MKGEMIYFQGKRGRGNCKQEKKMSGEMIYFYRRLESEREKEARESIDLDFKRSHSTTSTRVGVDIN